MKNIMKDITVLDTTVLVAGIVQAHPNHVACKNVLQEAAQNPGKFRCSLHAVAETFRVLVALPLSPRLDSVGARLAIRTTILPRLDPIPLTLHEYDLAMDLVVSSGLGSGAIDDCLHLLAAHRLSAKKLLTGNVKHFQTLAQALNQKILIQAPERPS
jgi:predicted nucleic acid-binding protein